MSDVQGQAWGMCAAYGCPLLGTVGSDGKWFCFCHVGKPSVFNDSITRVLREDEIAVVDMTLAIRACSLSGDTSPRMATAAKALKEHPLGAELRFKREADVTARGWLLRLERHLINATADIGEQKRIPSTVPTAPIIGPTHAMQHYSEIEQ
ncbi:MAG: hypothetical protein EPN70_03415 [Paraburkholderia sp.]|uniref:hypothetical protein n=1 Tax=Paraburkholderia sp. TaxID=1926495 RepID=UPI0012236315|nr:hypothetical protein [Paraburkholderia sp.]TAM07233.1 MAG: hypothetical protein EPN70_03415 [Paraburkholderia sp.]TAM32628.1 MAG: hypothetical protein EPN59_01645 [Paraburkholderia sp.]